LTLLFVRPGNPLFAPLLEFYPQGPPVAHVMVFYAFLLILLNFKKITQLTNEFFSGLGYGYANVISLIITANCFIAGLEAVGFMQSIITFIINSGPYAHVLGSLSVWGMAVISGSGTAPSVAFSPPQKNKFTETHGRIGKIFSRGLISRLVACKIACLHKKQCRDATYSQVIIILCSVSIIAI